MSDLPTLTHSERRTYYVDRHGVIRRRGTNRRRRSDYGTRKPHPPGCRHCESVETYRTIREASIEANGGHRNECASDGVITFKEWLVAQAREWRIERCMPNTSEPSMTETETLGMVG